MIQPLPVLGIIIAILFLNGHTIFMPLHNLTLQTHEDKPAKAIPFRQTSYQPSAVPKPSYKPFSAQASSAIIYDAASGKRLYEKSPAEQRAVASLNKLMTALVIMDEHHRDEVVTIEALPSLDIYDQKIGISESEQFKLGDLVKALLIHSANDAANALAIYDSGSIEAFSEKMEKKAKAWGLTNSSFANPSGLDNPNQLSTAEDLLVLTNILRHNQFFKEVVKTPTTKISNLAGKSYTLTNTNKLLGQNGIAGVKTGFTLNAGQCLITATTRQGNTIITVLLASPDRFQESKNMIDWAFNNHIWQ